MGSACNPARPSCIAMSIAQKLLFALLLLIALPSMAAAQVDVNGADAKALAQSLTGLSLAKAEAIVAYRTAHGPFRHVDDLLKVNGIGARFMSLNRDAIVILEARAEHRDVSQSSQDPAKSCP